MTEKQLLLIPAGHQPLIPATPINRGGVGKFDPTGLVDVAQNSMLKGLTLTSLKAPRVALRSNSPVLENALPGVLKVHLSLPRWIRTFQRVS